MRKRIRVTAAAAGLATAFASSAAFAEEVNVYSYRQPHLIEPLLAAFTQETGIKANVLSLQQGLIERVKTEGEASPADIILTVDIGRLTSAVREGVTQPVQDPEIYARVPANLRDPDGHWIGLTVRARIVYASRERTEPGEVATYEDLADPKWKGRVCIRSGLHRYNVALLAAYIEHHSRDEAKTWLEGVKANLARKPQGNDRAQVKAIWAGQCDISIGNTYYMGQMLEDPEQQAWTQAVRVEFPVFEGGGTHVNVSGVAMAKHAKNPENAKALIRYLTSTEAQRIYAEVNHEYPVDPAVPASAVVASWGTPERDTVDLSTIAGHNPETLKIVDEISFDEGP